MADVAPRTVLLVEDDPLYLELLQEAFRNAGFHTLQAANGEQAIQVVRREQVDLVVSDFIMPEVNGLELCRLLSDDIQFAGMKMILYSCNTDAAFRRRAREMGAIDYLPKSEDTAALVEQICALAGILQESDFPPAAILKTALPSPAATHAGQLRLLFDNLFDLVRIAALSEHASEPARVAWEAVQRSSGEIRRLLAEIEQGRAPLRPPEPAGLEVHH